MEDTHNSRNLGVYREFAKYEIMEGGLSGVILFIGRKSIKFGGTRCRSLKTEVLSNWIFAYLIFIAAKIFALQRQLTAIIWKLYL